jgi:hypothetical protein
MAASALAIAAQLTPVAITATEAIIKGALFAQKVQSANLVNRAQWIAMWDMADTQFLSGYDAVMGINPLAVAAVATASTTTPAASTSVAASTSAAAPAPAQTATATPAPSTSTTAATPNPTQATVA